MEEEEGEEEEERSLAIEHSPQQDIYSGTPILVFFVAVKPSLFNWSFYTEKFKISKNQKISQLLCVFIIGIKNHGRKRQHGKLNYYPKDKAVIDGAIHVDQLIRLHHLLAGGERKYDSDLER